uniref:Ig-like domain-containing protein n=1 Tax=Callorhinchus milii TaxID=7868 RepID=A0A4W3JJ15_CALMI
MMFALIFLMAFQPVSGQMRGVKTVTGVVGRGVVVECHYETEKYRQHEKYWCRGSNHITCTVLARTRQQPRHQGRVSIADNIADGVLSVAMEKLQADDTGQYWCGIYTVGFNPHFPVTVQVDDVAVSKPILRFLSPYRASCSGQTVSISCESVDGSLPIDYSWYQKSVNTTDLRVSDSGNLTLRCGNIGHGHGYYCSARNGPGSQSSDALQVSVLKTGAENCVYVVQIHSEGKGYSCEDGCRHCSREEAKTSEEIHKGKSRVIHCVLCILGLLGVVLVISGIFYKRRRKMSKKQVKPRDTPENRQDFVAQVSRVGEDCVADDMGQRVPDPTEGDAQGSGAGSSGGEDITYETVGAEGRRPAVGSGEEDGITYAVVQLQGRSRSGDREETTDKPPGEEGIVYVNVWL